MEEDCRTLNGCAYGTDDKHNARFILIVRTRVSDRDVQPAHSDTEIPPTLMNPSLLSCQPGITINSQLSNFGEGECEMAARFQFAGEG